MAERVFYGSLFFGTYEKIVKYGFYFGCRRGPHYSFSRGRGTAQAFDIIGNRIFHFGYSALFAADYEDSESGEVAFDCGPLRATSAEVLADETMTLQILWNLFGNALKYGIAAERPYSGVFNSFPSGHTYTAFMGAEILRREYGEEDPGIAIAGYTVATSVGIMRIYNNRHWASDVLAGAGIGILSASLTYWLAPYLTF